MKAAMVVALFIGLATGMDAQQPQQVIGGQSAAVSPDGRRIAFASNRSGTAQIYTISTDGSNERQETHSPDAKGGPTWSADGQQLTYVAVAHDTTRIYLIEHGGAIHQIGTAPGRMAVISPDRKRLLYSAGTWTANKLVTADLDGGNARQITDSSSIAWNMRWSPDGKQIAFTSRNPGESNLAVFIMNADGSGRRQVSHIAPDRGGAQVPAWSRDGRQLAVQVSDTTRTGGVWVVDIATGNARELTPHRPGYEDEIPTWFPDGKRIAFQSDRTGRMEIWVMNADGTGQRQVTGTKSGN